MSLFLLFEGNRTVILSRTNKAPKKANPSMQQKEFDYLQLTFQQSFDITMKTLNSIKSKLRRLGVLGSQYLKKTLLHFKQHMLTLRGETGTRSVQKVIKP